MTDVRSQLTQTDTVGDGATAAGGGLESLTYANTAVVVANLDRVIQWYGRHLGFTERARVRILDGANVALLEGAGTQLKLHRPQALVMDMGRWLAP